MLSTLSHQFYMIILLLFMQQHIQAIWNVTFIEFKLLYQLLLKQKLLLKSTKN